MDESPLGRLAPELRNRIYELALTQERPIIMLYTHDPRYGRGQVRQAKPSTPHLLALPGTCKQARSEALQLLYACNAFKLRISSDGWQEDGIYCSALQQLAGSIGRPNLRVVARLVLDIGKLTREMYDELILVITQGESFVSSEGLQSLVIRAERDGTVVDKRLPAIYRKDLLMELDVNQRPFSCDAAIAMMEKAIKRIPSRLDLIRPVRDLARLKDVLLRIEGGWGC